ncbi:DUF1048 domain-containing protein [Mycetocola lacteus]|uniref:DUF1048 domain-containing protein n=1 Tax=Mycetocola lacteus TaxID=76637 RepID=A0A3L7AS31_9MICO|nr:DUF1048 domain-containing protein [Mycetocola lacteus]RLP83227.1 DUF1048 domain-containing protein [Mycetocola lacteus]
MFISRMINEKKRYRAYKARTAALPRPYRASIDALEHYLMYFGPDKSSDLTVMLEDLADLFDNAAADGVPVAAIVGEDPVEFAETFRLNYPAGQWIIRERERLTRAITEATASA